MTAFSQLLVIWRSSFKPLRLPNLRIYLGGQAISLVGTFLQVTAQSLLVYKLSEGSATALGIVAVATALPMLVLSLWVGPIIDRLDRQKLIIVTQVGEMLLAFILAWLIQSNQTQLWHVYVLAFLLGTMESIYFPAQQAYLGDIVGMAEIRPALNLYAMIVNVSRAAGPAIAGYIIGTFGLAISFWLNGLSFLPVVFSLLIIHSTVKQARPSAYNESNTLINGLRYIRQNPQLGNVYASVALLNAFGLAVYAIIPALVHGDATQTGLLLGAAGAGSLCCVFFVMPIINRVQRQGLVLCGALIWMGFWLIVLSRSTWFPLSLFSLLLAGLATTIVWIGSLGLLQLLPPANMRARMLSMFSIVSFGVQPIASLLLGYLADQITTPTVVFLSGLTMAGLAALMLTQTSWRDWRMQQAKPTPEDIAAEVPAELSHV